MASARGSQVGKLFGEGGSRARAVFAEEASDLEGQAHVAPTDRQVKERSAGTAVNSDRLRTADGAGACRGGQVSQESDRFIAYDHALDGHSWEGSQYISKAH